MPGRASSPAQLGQMHVRPRCSDGMRSSVARAILAFQHQQSSMRLPISSAQPFGPPQRGQALGFGLGSFMRAVYSRCASKTLP
jgi:hypothetical protein